MYFTTDPGDLLHVLGTYMCLHENQYILYVINCMWCTEYCLPLERGLVSASGWFAMLHGHNLKAIWARLQIDATILFYTELYLMVRL